VGVVRHGVVIALVLFALALPAAGAAAGTALTITIWPDERRAEVYRFSLRCQPTGGTLPRAATACTRLAAGGPALFAPIPEDRVCIQIYGGPQRAIVSGTIGGRRIWVSLRRGNGCEIERWSRLSFLLPMSRPRLP
jgi:Subtilisin inhibitor-like